MLANHVETEPLHFRDVKAQCLVRRRGVDAIRPEALIERAGLKHRLAVQQHGRETFLVFAERNLSHPEVTGDFIAAHPHFQIVEERIFRRPEMRVRDWKFQLIARLATDARDFLVTVERDDFNIRCGRRAAGIYRDPQTSCIHVRNQLQVLDGSGDHGFKPHRLPDARARRVGDAAGLGDLVEILFAERLSRAGRVEHRHDQFIFRAGLQRIGNVERERIITSSVFTDGTTIDENLRLPIHRAKVQQQSFAVREFGRRERAAIPEALLIRQRLLHAGQRRLNRERHENFSRECFRPGRRHRLNGVIPQPVQIDPIFPHHLRARIVGQRAARIHVRTPPRHDLAGHGLPCLSRQRGGHKSEDQRAGQWFDFVSHFNFVSPT